MEIIVEEKLKPFLIAIKQSIIEKNWYAATALSLTMPDICGKLSNPFEKSNKRYALWFDKYVGERYSYERNGNRTVFATGNDIYALRCAFLHQGESNIASQRAKETADKIRLQAPKITDKGEFYGSHNIKIDRFLYIRIDVLCEDIIWGIEKWIEVNKVDEKINSRALNLTTIDDSDYNSGGIFIH